MNPAISTVTSIIHNTIEADRLCEVVSDITTDVYCHLNNMEEDDRDALMDAIEGSRGLFWQHILPWAKEYQVGWNKLTEIEQEKKSQDYLTDIDSYTQEKFKVLLAEHGPGKVESVQVIPVIERAGHVTPQFEGPTGDTTGWAVYERNPADQANWAADFRTEDMAMRFAVMHATALGVHVEPQPWKQPAKQAEIAVKLPEVPV